MSEGLAPKERRLVRLVAAMVLGRWEELARLRRAAPAGEPDREWREAVLQTHLFAGFPRLVEAYEVLDRAGGLGAPQEGEVGAPIADGGERAGDDGDPGRGAALFERIYGDDADDVRSRLALFHPDFARWIAEHAYGRVLARPGLSAARRELCAIAALVALGQDRQLASHARGAVRCGATPDQVAGVLEAIADQARPERIERARGVIARFAR